jgi:hypothetical protein
MLHTGLKTQSSVRLQAEALHNRTDTLNRTKHKRSSWNKQYCSVAMNSDLAIASQKLHTDLLAIQNWFKKWRMEDNGSKPIHVTFTTRRETCPSVHINSVQLPQEEDVKYLGLRLDRRLTWHKRIFSKLKQLGITVIKKYWLLGRKSKLSTSNKFFIYKTILEPIWT